MSQVFRVRFKPWRMIEQLGKDMYTFSRLFIQDVFRVGHLVEAESYSVTSWTLFEGLNILIITFCECVDWWVSMSLKSLSLPYTLINFLIPY